MADSVVLRDEDVGRIGEYVKPWLRELVHEMALRNEPDEVSTQVLERMTRVEEELKTLGGAVRSQGETLNSQGATLRSQGETLRSQGETLKAQGETFRAHTEELRAQGATLRDHTEELRAQRELLGAHRELMDERFAFTQERLTTLTWMIGVGFVVITSLTTVFGLLA